MTKRPDRPQDGCSGVQQPDRRAFLRAGGAAAAGGWLLARGGGLALAGQSAQRLTPVVETSSGRMRGLMIGPVHAFKGIHYGASTAGDRRFMPPAPPVPWTGVRDMTRLGERAPQSSLDIMFVSFPQLERPEPEGEDCLCLNIWTNGLSGKRPVMVWLHGGLYSTGSGGFIAYDGTNIAHHEDVVAVTLNHRLNVFGFLDVEAIGGGKYARSANLGMQDIVAALRWVRNNIDRFGGDPNNVTIYGQSGGGGKVSTLLAMPPAKGLFHRSIVESGSTLRQPTNAAGAELAHAFLAHMKLKSVDELQRVPWQQIRSVLMASAKQRTGPPNLGGTLVPRSFALAFGPVVDGQWLARQPFDPNAPQVSADVPLLVGNNQTEVNFFPGAQLNPISEQQLRAEVRRILHTDEAGADRVIAVYRAARPSDTPLDVLQILLTDLSLRRDARLQADRKAEQGTAAVYVYYFDWRSPVLGGRLKSYHTLEIPFVMQNLRSCEVMVGTGPGLAHMASQISGAWAAFARSGNPNYPGLPHWPAYDVAHRPTMILDTHPRAVDDPNRTEREAVAAVSHRAPAAT